MRPLRCRGKPQCRSLRETGKEGEVRKGQAVWMEILDCRECYEKINQQRERREETARTQTVRTRGVERVAAGGGDDVRGTRGA